MEHLSPAEYFFNGARPFVEPERLLDHRPVENVYIKRSVPTTFPLRVQLATT